MRVPECVRLCACGERGGHDRERGRRQEGGREGGGRGGGREEGGEDGLDERGTGVMHLQLYEPRRAHPADGPPQATKMWDVILRGRRQCNVDLPAGMCNRLCIFEIKYRSLLPSQCLKY